MDRATPAYEVVNADAGGAVLLSAPHAGRDYAEGLHARLRAPVEKLTALEDRFVDLVARGQTLAPAVIARSPRVWIDLNRHEAEIDTGLVTGLSPSRALHSVKVRSGLGLIPRRLGGVGELWRSSLAFAEVEARIASVHRPYHAELATRMATLVARCGVGVLIDLHSMPPLPDRNGEQPPRVVIGNRYGQTAASWVTARIAGTADRFGWAWRENSPYAGGHIVERHGRPARGLHAVQVELDRSLYLDAALDQPDPAGIERARAFLTELVSGLQVDALDWAWPQAAE